jgi:large conductance mechanosensitive channel
VLKGFKDFILRGNIIELAIAVVIGTAFTAVVGAFTKSIINPIIAAFGGHSADGLAFHLISGNPATLVDFGSLITAAITFAITAAVVYFIFVVPMNKLSQRRKRGEVQVTADPTELELLVEIRDLLKAQREVSSIEAE